jgi:hypothetical protein
MHPTGSEGPTPTVGVRISGGAGSDFTESVEGGGYSSSGGSSVASSSIDYLEGLDAANSRAATQDPNQAWRIEPQLCESVPDVDPIRKTLGVPVPCQSRTRVGLALVGEVSGSYDVGVSDCNIALIGESLQTCVPGVHAAKKQPEQRPVFDHKAIYALDNPGPGLPSCGRTCKAALAAAVLVVAFLYFLYRTCVGAQSECA